MIVHNGNIVVNNGRWIIPPPPPPVDPYNPLGLPPNTVRVRTNDGNVPKKDGVGSGASYETATLVPGTTDVYDVYKSGTFFNGLLYGSNNVVEVLGANTSGVTYMMSMFAYGTALQSVALFDTSKVTDMFNMFDGCTALQSVPLFDTSKVTDMTNMFSVCSHLITVPLFNTSNVTNMKYMFNDCISLQTVPLFDTSKVTDMRYMFEYCDSLTNVPLFDTSKVTNMSYMFQYCTSVQSGALALYQQASTQANPPSNHGAAFRSCGSNTTTGAAELAQIPSGWK